MNVTYNGLAAVSATSLITFSDIPNILSVRDSDSGTYATMKLIFTNPSGGLSWHNATTGDSQWFISFLGETITNVIDPKNANNKSFYISSSMVDTAESIAKAFRNCPTVNAMFQIYIDRESVNQHIVWFKARTIGSVWTALGNELKYTQGLNTYMAYAGTNGTSTSSLYGSKIDVDVYGQGGYITTLEKSFYGTECAFNMTPVLNTITKVGELTPYKLYITAYSSSGATSSLGSISQNYATEGFMCNQGQDFLKLTSGITIAQNVSRGTYRNHHNNTILYVYGDTIPLDFYCASSAENISYTVTYRDSALGVITAETNTVSLSTFNHCVIGLTSARNSAFYIDVTIGDKTMRYNVIKPLKAASGYQRLEWRNSYGGISFFDFTGTRSDSREMDVSTYQKNNFDYYTRVKREKEKVYDNDVKYTTTLKSHLMAEDGKWLFNELPQSPEVWTTINNVPYAVIIDSVSVDEQNNQNVWEATVKYHLSESPSNV